MFVEKDAPFSSTTFPDRTVALRVPFSHFLFFTPQSLSDDRGYLSFQASPLLGRSPYIPETPVSDDTEMKSLRFPFCGTLIVGEGVDVLDIRLSFSPSA